MTTIAFDTLGYAKKLENAGFTREQAEAQANFLSEIMTAKAVSKDYLDARLREKEIEQQQELEERAISREFLDTRLRELDSRIRESELRLQKEIEKIKYDLLKWQIGGFIAMAAIMAKGFHWLGF